MPPFLAVPAPALAAAAGLAATFAAGCPFAAAPGERGRFALGLAGLGAFGSVAATVGFLATVGLATLRSTGNKNH